MRLMLSPSYLARNLAALSCTLIATLGLVPANLIGLGSGPAYAQNSQQNCQPPRSNEYLLLVLNDRTDTQSRVQQLFSQNNLNPILTACRYLGDSVIRVESFASADVANDWARFLTNSNLQAFVTRPRTGGNIGNPPNNPSTPGRTGYNPQTLGNGFAVIVNYFNNPDTAASVRQITRQNVGLVSYNQNPYLLASYTTDSAAASNVLRSLTDRGLVAIVVDSRNNVFVLTPNVVESGGSSFPNNNNNNNNNNFPNNSGGSNRGG
jgi:hypothetical protein